MASTARSHLCSLISFVLLASQIHGSLRIFVEKTESPIVLCRGLMCSNTREVRDAGRICKDCRQECSNPSGWNLQGSDWGCCGNYEGCCTYASFICYIHDALCRCCDAGDAEFCGPTCKPEADCSTPSIIHPCQQEADCLETSTEQPCIPEVGCQAASGSKINPVSDAKGHPYGDKEMFKQTRTLKNGTTTTQFDVDDVESNFTSTQSERERFPSTLTVTDIFTNSQTVTEKFTSSQTVTERFATTKTLTGIENTYSERTSHTLNEDSLNDGSGETEYRPFV